jgi:uncharacterized protein (TIGR02118 family)
MKRPSTVERASFQRWWVEDHGPIARQIPGLRRYVVSFSDDPVARFDGMAELWFDDWDALRAGLASDQGLLARDDALSHAGERVTINVTETEMTIESLDGIS